MKIVFVMLLAGLTFTTADKIMPAICLKDPDTGPCKANRPQFFFNISTVRCEIFKYGGCKGNENRFNTEKECKDKCHLSDIVEGPAVGAMQIGPGQGQNIRCMNTVFCHKSCQYGLQIDSNNCLICRCRTTDPCKSTVCPEKHKCKLFHGHLPGEKIAKCIDPNIPDKCQEPAVAGPCYASYLRWYFNMNTLSCETFIYGGCGGNDNSFTSRHICIHHCMQVKERTLHPRCNFSPSPGSCSNSRGTYWYYNTINKRCEQFVYGGCGGNPNRFNSLEECHAYCPSDIDIDPRLYKCPRVRCLMMCQFGMETDPAGCTICKCKQNPCQLVKCAPFQECRLFNCNSFPCEPSVKCVNSTSILFSPCRKLKCKACAYGYTRDTQGCPTCNCVGDPCEGIKCPSLHVCRKKRIPHCRHAPCSYEAVCLPSRTGAKGLKITVKFWKHNWQEKKINEELVKRNVKTFLSKMLNVKEDHIVGLQAKHMGAFTMAVSFGVLRQGNKDIVESLDEMRSRLVQQHNVEIRIQENAKLVPVTTSMDADYLEQGYDQGDQHRAGTLAGAVVGGLVAVIAIAVLVVAVMRWRNRRTDGPKYRAYDKRVLYRDSPTKDDDPIA